MQETWVRSLGQENHLEEEGMAIHPNIPDWRIPWTEVPGRLQSVGSQRDTTEVTARASACVCVCNFSLWFITGY